MLKKDYTEDLIDYVNTIIDWKKLNNALVDSIIIDTEEYFGVAHWTLTPYNVRQISRMSNSIMDSLSGTPEEIAEIIIDNNYNKSFIKTFESVKEKDYVKKSRLLWNSNDFLNHLKTFIEWYKPHKVDDIKMKKVDKANKPLVIALTDLHLWKQWSDLVINRLWTIANDIINSGVNKVTIFCVWDLVETLVQWWMHDWQIEAMWDTYWFNLLMKVVNVFERFLLTIRSQWIHIDFYWLSGNHDRMTKDREWDKSRLWWLVIYELIKRWVANASLINIHIVQDYITTVDVEDIRYIVAHWDMARIPNRKWTDIAWSHWDTTKSHNVILYWHLHNVSITEEKSITKVWLPWLAGTDKYATKELDLHSEPAYVQIIHNSYWSIDLLIKRLEKDV